MVLYAIENNVLSRSSYNIFCYPILFPMLLYFCLVCSKIGNLMGECSPFKTGSFFLVTWLCFEWVMLQFKTWSFKTGSCAGRSIGLELETFGPQALEQGAGEIVCVCHCVRMQLDNMQTWQLWDDCDCHSFQPALEVFSQIACAEKTFAKHSSATSWCIVFMGTFLGKFYCFSKQNGID